MYSLSIEVMQAAFPAASNSPRPALLCAARVGDVRRTAATRHRYRVRANADDKDSEGYLPNEESQEKFVDVAAVLRDLPNELVFELNEDEEDDEWTHENRFIRHSKEAQPIAEVKGALDPNQADILSAYSSEQGFQEVDVHYCAYHMQDSPEIDIVDVRTAQEYKTGHIASSRNIPLDDLSRAVKEGQLTDKLPLAIICARGGRSAQACVRLSKVFGFPNVTNIKGGMNAWIGAGLPILQ